MTFADESMRASLTAAMGPNAANPAIIEPQVAKPRAKPILLPMFQNAQEAQNVARRLIRILGASPANIRASALAAVVEYFDPKPPA